MPHALADAQLVAFDVRGWLSSACVRIEIAGSVRRRRPQVKDIELVAVPRFEDAPTGDLWGATERRDLLVDRLAELRTSCKLVPRLVDVHRADGSIEQQYRMGTSYQALVAGGIPIDLFIVRAPAEYGVIFAIRTGPGDWNTRIVTDCQRFFRRVSGGQVLHFGKPVPCPEEADFFAAVGQPWIEPWERTVERVRLSFPKAAVSI